jgi:AraC-like DNA-binding protein
MKTKSVLPFNWRNDPVIDTMKVVSIDKDFILLDKPLIMSVFDYPFKVDVTVAIISIRGTTEGAINLAQFSSVSPCLITILPGQIMQYKSISDDFEGLFIIMSQKFTDSLMPNASERMPIQLSVRDNPAIPLDNSALEGMISYFEMIKRVMVEEYHPYRMEVVRYLTLAFFYGAGVYFHKIADSENRKMTQHEVLVGKFLQLVHTHYREQRGLEFYADKLCITAKHLSKVIKATSSKSAGDWIDDHVALEAKALLKSTNMTVEQISDELNFPSQSFFGKYFKRVTGVSPRDYKIKG